MLKLQKLPKNKKNTKWLKMHYKLTIFGAWAPYPRLIYCIASSISQGKKDDMSSKSGPCSSHTIQIISFMILIHATHLLYGLYLWVIFVIKCLSVILWCVLFDARWHPIPLICIFIEYHFTLYNGWSVFCPVICLNMSIELGT